MEVMEDHIPRCCISGRKNLPWITRGVRRCMHRRDKSRAKKSDSPKLWCKFRGLRNKVVSILKLAKKEFFRSLSAKLKEFKRVYHSMTSTHQRVPSMLTSGTSSKPLC